MTIRVEYQPMWRAFGKWAIIKGFALPLDEAMQWVKRDPSNNNIIEVYVIQETKSVVATRYWEQA